VSEVKTTFLDQGPYELTLLVLLRREMSAPGIVHQVGLLVSQKTLTTHLMAHINQMLEEKKK